MERPGWERLLQFRCTGCGNCCKGTYICITDADARRLSEGLGRPIDDFVRFAAEDEITLGKRHAWWVRFARRRGVMVLRWRRGRCIFLDGETAGRHTGRSCRPSLQRDAETRTRRRRHAVGERVTLVARVGRPRTKRNLRLLDAPVARAPATSPGQDVEPPPRLADAA
jgi:Fe-S-cluster containining protein